MRIVRRSLVSASIIGSLLLTGGVAGALPHAGAAPSSGTTSVDASLAPDAPTLGNLDLISELNAAGIPSRTEVVDGVVLHIYTNRGVELVVPEHDPDRITTRIGVGFGWSGPYLKLNRSEQIYAAGMGVTALATQISVAFPPASAAAVPLAWGVINYVQNNGVCRNDMRVHLNGALTCS